MFRSLEIGPEVEKKNEIMDISIFEDWVESEASYHVCNPTRVGCTAGTPQRHKHVVCKQNPNGNTYTKRRDPPLLNSEQIVATRPIDVSVQANLSVYAH